MISHRQQEMAHLVMRGLSNKEIARELGISPITVRETLHIMFRRLNVRNRAQLAVWASHQIGSSDHDPYD